MGSLKTQQIPAAVEPHARESIPPTDRLHAIADFVRSGLKDAPCTLALTDHALWIFFWNGSSDYRRWTRTDSIAFDEIITITTRLVTMPIRNFYQLSLQLPGGMEGIRNFKSLYVEGEAFIKQFQQLLSNRRAGPVSPADELAKLNLLAAEGVLSKDEWERAKGLYLGKTVDARDEAVRLLRNLHEMHRTGILSESEFNTKKWDILTKL